MWTPLDKVEAMQANYLSFTFDTVSETSEPQPDELTEGFTYEARTDT